MIVFSNIPQQVSGVQTTFKGASARIDEIFDALLHNEETDVMNKVEGFRKLVNELCPYLDANDEKIARACVKAIHTEAVKLMANQPNQYADLSDEFEGEIRRAVKELKEAGRIN